MKNKTPVVLPRADQMHALMDAIVQAKFALRQTDTVLESLGAHETNEAALTMIRLARKDIAVALAPWEVE